MTQVKNVIRDNYNAMLLNEFLRKEIKDAGFSKVDITKTPTGTRVTLYVTKPGIVIGKKGFGIKALTEKLETDYGLKNPQVVVEEILKPELSPSVMCNRMGSHIERGTAFRRATMWTLQQIMDGGAMGVQITVSGKLRGDRSAFEKHTAGILPRSGYHAETIVDEDINVGGSGSLLSATDNSAIANGIDTGALTLQLKESDGDDISLSGVDVTFTIASGTALFSNNLTTYTTTTNASGIASASVKSLVSGTVNITTTIDRDEDGGTTPEESVSNGAPASVSFFGYPAGQLSHWWGQGRGRQTHHRSQNGRPKNAGHRAL